MEQRARTAPDPVTAALATARTEEERSREISRLTMPTLLFAMNILVALFTSFTDYLGPVTGWIRCGYCLAVLAAFAPVVALIVLGQRRDGGVPAVLEQIDDVGLLGRLLDGAASLGSGDTMGLRAAFDQAATRLSARATMDDRGTVRPAVPAIRAALACAHASADAPLSAALLNMAARLGMGGLQAEAARLAASAWRGAQADAAREAARSYLQACGVSEGVERAVDLDELARARSLVRMLYAGRPRHQRTAESALVRMGVVGSQAILEHIAELRRTRPSRRRWYVIGVLWRAGLAAALVAAMLVPAWMGLAVYWTPGVAALYVFPWRVLRADGGDPVEAELAGALARMDDRRAVGLLLQAHARSGRHAAPRIARALCRLLPQMTPADAGALTPSQRARLLRLLKGKDTELVVATLRALEQIGHEGDIPCVTPLAAEGSNVPTEVREAAGQCLAYLLMRTEQERASKTLLRPAAAGAESNTLLRPAGRGEPSDADRLLRPE